MLAAVYKSCTWCIYCLMQYILVKWYTKQAMLAAVYKSCAQCVDKFLYSIFLVLLVYKASYAGSSGQVLFMVYLLCQMLYIFSFNWYTKRAMLAAVFKSNATCIYYVQCSIYFSTKWAMLAAVY